MTDLQPLAQYVVESAHQEVVTKAKMGAPALRTATVAGACGALAAAAAYRLSVLLLEKVMPSEMAALTAMAVYGTGAGWAAAVTLRRLRETPLPLPIDTARRVADAVADREPSP